MVKSSLKLIDDLMLRETLTPLIASEKGRYVSFGILALSGILLFAAVIHTFSAWHSDFIISRQMLSTDVVNKTNQESGLVENIPSQHLFGQNAIADYIPVTSLQLRLTGVIKNSQNKTSRVIISEAGQPGKIYALGEEITSGVKINAINEDGVILQQGDHFEKLPLARQGLTFSEKPKALWAM